MNRGFGHAIPDIYRQRLGGIEHLAGRHGAARQGEYVAGTGQQIRVQRGPSLAAAICQVRPRFQPSARSCPTAWPG